MSRPHETKTGLYIFFAIIALAIVFFFAKGIKAPDSNLKDLQRGSAEIGENKLEIYLAKTPLEQAEGLSNFNTLGTDEGMLFIYDTPSKPAFWMKEMKFPIDIIWILDNKIVDITENVSTDNGELTKYYPNSDINRVLEVRAGYCQKNNVKRGDEIKTSF